MTRLRRLQVRKLSVDALYWGSFYLAVIPLWFLAQPFRFLDWLGRLWRPEQLYGVGNWSDGPRAVQDARGAESQAD